MQVTKTQKMSMSTMEEKVKENEHTRKKNEKEVKYENELCSTTEQLRAMKIKTSKKKY